MMKRRKLFMIGNSHIDPVWFWDWEEGMQEVKATFLSALERLREFPEMKFTCTSTAFLEWFEKVEPERFEEIRQRAAEGRWELTGGWFVEPDCTLPSGEAFVRQGLYGQRYLRKRFGRMARVGSNVDSFGHAPSLPQILKKSGLDCYVFMRPRLADPAFVWEGPDGSRVKAVSLPSEYTTWFYEQLKEQIGIAGAAMDAAGTDVLPCCYGVGNHGGGPTIENVKSIYRLREELPDTELVFAGYEEYFEAADYRKAPVISREMKRINTGCYETDSEFKRVNRLCEKQLVLTEKMLSLCRSMTGGWMAECGRLETLWKGLLFNQFHDTLGGTEIKDARDQAYAQLCAVSAGCGQILAAARQNIMNMIDTRGEGFPLFLFHFGNAGYDGYVAAELNWFCKHPLTLLDSEGNEVLYQRVHTRTKTRNYNIGGRRQIVFRAKLPEQGFAVYRAVVREPSVVCHGWEIDRPDAYVMENEKLRVSFGRESGMLESLFRKETGCEMLKGPVTYDVWEDERDSWGAVQDKSEGNRGAYRDSGEKMRLSLIEKSESGPCRECIHVIYEYGNSRLEQFWYLYAGEEEVVTESRVFWMEGWKTLRMRIPVTEEGAKRLYSRAEQPYGILKRVHERKEEILPLDTCNMQRFVDVYGVPDVTGIPDGSGEPEQSGGFGIAVANNGRYAYLVHRGALLITLARGSIYAQGSGAAWYNPSEGYEYMDMGRLDVTLVIRPHEKQLPADVLYSMAERASVPYSYMLDTVHEGEKKLKGYTLIQTSDPCVYAAAVKKAEDDSDYIVRLIETGGRERRASVMAAGRIFEFRIGAYEILTLKLNPESGSARTVNLLEDPEGDGLLS